MRRQEETKQIQETQPGLRFYPTEEELVSFSLNKMLENQASEELNKVIPAINIYAFEPWQLPKLSGELCNGDTEQWFFFVPWQEREALGGRPSRTTTSGYWKATGSPSYVYSSDNRVIGVKKSLVFYQGKAPTGTKTKWKMHEYRAITREMPSPSSSHLAIPKLRHEGSLCRVYVISGSFRAFDRRPLGIGTSGEKATDEAAAQHSNSGSQLCSQSATATEGRSSLEISALTNENAREVSSSSLDNEEARIWDMDSGLLTSLFEWDHELNQ